mgnify:CR=1 FL=1
MKLLLKFLHIAADILIVFLLIGVPVLRYCDIKVSGNYDAVSSASVVLPDSPSGEFLIFINKDYHEDTYAQWEDFFTGENMSVIFDDVSCLVPKSDKTGIEFANRYMAILPENQMSVRMEDSTLIASKITEGYLDIVIMSEEMADILKTDDTSVPDNIVVIKVS